MRPPAAKKRSLPGINACTKLPIPRLVRCRKSLFAKVVPEETAIAKLGGRDGQIMYRLLNMSPFWSGEEHNA